MSSLSSYRILLTALLGCLPDAVARAQWIELANVQINRGHSELAGSQITLSYALPDAGISAETPAYVFVRYSPDKGATWRLLPKEFLRGDGFGIVNRPGRATVTIWGAPQVLAADQDDIRFRIRALFMARVPAGEYEPQTIPGAGLDTSARDAPPSPVQPLYYMARCEVTIGMYVDFLNEVGESGTGWDDRMANENTCGILRSGAAPGFRYRTAPGRANYPIVHVSWYTAQAFLHWCGLQLPTEAEWEKAVVGGKFLDGDASKRMPNPRPKRLYPWGNEPPVEGKLYRCNLDGAEDGFAYSAPVGSFPHDKSPNGIFDMAGNVAEWTIDWYTTSWHPGADGYRVIRGGAWTAFPEAVDAIAQPTMLPIKTSGIVGFRGVRRGKP